MADNDNGTLVGLRDLMRKLKEQRDNISKENSMDVETSSGPAKNYAGGGEIHSVPQEPVPPLNAVASSLNTIPDTNYDFYGSVGDDERKALYDSLQAQARSPQAVVAQGLGGIGDAIANSFGGQNRSFQKDIMAMQEGDRAGQLQAFDTQRAQKREGMQASQDMMMNDPNSPTAQSLRKVLKSKGINAPSGMSASVLMRIMGPLGEMAMKEATLGIQGAQLEETREQNAFNRGLAQDKLAADQASSAAAAKEKEAQNRFDAAKGLNSRSTIAKVGDFFSKSDATKEMEEQLKGGANHGVPDLGETFNGGKVMKVTRIQ